LPFIVHLASELSDRLLQAEDRLLAQYLIPANSSNLTDEQIHAIYTACITDLTARDFEEFDSEIRRWRARHSLEDSQLSTICLHVLLAMSVSTATAERSFSSMRRLKTYLRSTVFVRRKERRLALIFNVYILLRITRSPLTCTYSLLTVFL